MSKVLKNMKRKAKATLGQAVEYVKDKVTTMMGTTSVPVGQLVDYIRNHPGTKMEKKELLGLSFSFYQLEKEGVHYYVEMKGSYILQVDVHTVDDVIVSYRSYRDNATVPLKIPEFLSFEQ
jgi:hypothetical protein